MKKIAAIGTFEAYRHLVRYCDLPPRNEIFHHVQRIKDAIGGEFSAMIFIGNPHHWMDADKLAHLEKYVQTRIR